jgi:hypothetical protein
MFKLSGVRMSKPAFQDLIFVGRILENEKRIVDLYTNPEHEPFLKIWVDANEELKRWLIFRTTPAQFKDYLAGKASLHELVMKPADLFVYSVDIDPDNNILNPRLNATSKLPGPYQQSKMDFFDPLQCPDMAGIDSFVGKL